MPATEPVFVCQFATLDLLSISFEQETFSFLSSHNQLEAKRLLFRSFIFMKALKVFRTFKGIIFK
jgi:hypothetical protein